MSKRDLAPWSCCTVRAAKNHWLIQEERLVFIAKTVHQAGESLRKKIESKFAKEVGVDTDESI